MSQTASQLCPCGLRWCHCLMWCPFHRRLHAFAIQSRDSWWFSLLCIQVSHFQIFPKPLNFLTSQRTFVQDLALDAWVDQAVFVKREKQRTSLFFGPWHNADFLQAGLSRKWERWGFHHSGVRSSRYVDTLRTWKLLPSACLLKPDPAYESE